MLEENKMLILSNSLQLGSRNWDEKYGRGFCE